ncbi:mitochondrial alternative oxidase [Podospora didyma]|uniref:Alternative oxidase n=1 Tax=Podospora didyma TaxID=330526 RepID=A0AAE0NYB3_9PEZI|nr:mitochondrial alternative oxidase [Podospora didyma]
MHPAYRHLGGCTKTSLLRGGTRPLPHRIHLATLRISQHSYRRQLHTRSASTTTATETEKDALTIATEADPDAPEGQTPVDIVHLTWPHKGWTEDVLHAVIPSHRAPRTAGDRFAWRVTRICRWAMDFATGMGADQKVDGKHPTTAVVAQKPLTEEQWMIRFIFLESIAGVPGIVAGTLRHLHSIRRFRPDHGWIKTLLEESYNERMHLLVFLEMYKPGWFMQFMVFAAQGVFFNTMFVSYLVSPQICHRFVGYLEEEAVHTYTRCLEEMDSGSLKGWEEGEGFKIPEVAVRYWRMEEGKRSMRDLILNIRADEASHRGVNHTLGNLDQTVDHNPFVEGGMEKGEMQRAVTKPGGLERDEVIRNSSR